jgi:osmotically-inducible protein OsmY
MKTDIQLQRDVLDELLYEPAVDPTHIGITTDDGVVTLAGELKSLAEKWSAVRAAERVTGVKAIIDKLHVALPISHQRSDEEITAAVLNAFKWDVLVPEDRIKVHVENGCVILKGIVDHKYEQIAVENAIRNLAGIKKITNHVKFKAQVVPSDVKTRIESAMRRAAELDAHSIQVDVLGSKVVLRGRVRSWAERNEAKRAAWSAPGVTDVEDKMGLVA